MELIAISVLKENDTPGVYVADVLEDTDDLHQTTCLGEDYCVT